MKIARNVAILITFCIVFITASEAQNTAKKDTRTTSASQGSRPEWLTKYSNQEVRERFSNPPMFYAPHTFWFWDDVIKDENLAASMVKEMVKQRLNPGYAHPRSGMDPKVTGLPLDQYLEEPWFNSFGNALQAAKDNEMTFSYCDDYNWPSGQAGGRVLKEHPDLKALSLLPKRHSVSGNTEVKYDSVDFAVAAKLTNNEMIDAATLRIIGEGNNIKWTVPDGDWVVYTYTIRHHPGIDGGRVNYLDPKLMEVFIPMVHEQYDKHYKNDMGKSMPGVFVDNEGDYGWKMAWSEHFAKRYKEKKKRDIRTWLPLLTEKDKDGLFVVARHDWFDVVSDVYNECYFIPLVSWLEERNMYYISNLWEESLQLQTAGAGDVMRTTRLVTMPGNDCLMMVSQEVHDFKEIQTVAELEDRPFMSEVMGVAGWVQTPEMMKMTVNSVTSFGVSHIVPHGIYMNRTLETVPFPADWYNENPYWNYLHYWTDFARRASFVTRQSRLVADVLLVTPIESMWAFSETYFMEEEGVHAKWDDRADEANRIHSEVMKRMNMENIDFLIADKHYLDEGKIQSSGKDAKITIKDHEFRAMVMPPAYIMSHSALKKIYDFAKQGGLVVVLGQLPHGSPEKGLNDKEIEDLSDALRQLPSVIDLASESDKMGVMARVLKTEIKPQMRFENAGRLFTAQRKKDDTNLYWLANNTDTLKHFTAWLRDGKGTAEIWDCETGEKRSIASGTEDGYHKVSLTLNPYEAYWVVFNPDNKNVARPIQSQVVIKEEPINTKWTIRYPSDKNVVYKSTAKVYYSNDSLPDEAKFQPEYDDFGWNYFSRYYEENIKSIYAYWRMNISIGAKSVTVPSYMMGKAIWLDGKQMNITDSLISLTADANMLSFAIERKSDTLSVAPFKFEVETKVNNKDLDSWYSYGIQQYSGFLDYETSITVDKTTSAIFLDLGKVKYMAEVFVNGKSVGARLWPPFKFDISENLKPGENKIKVKIGNLIANELWIKDDMGKLRNWNWAWAADPDLSQYSAGLLGPVKLVYTKRDK